MKLETFIAQTKFSKGCEEKRNVAHARIRSILDGLYLCLNEGFEIEHRVVHTMGWPCL